MHMSLQVKDCKCMKNNANFKAAIYGHDDNIRKYYQPFKIMCDKIERINSILSEKIERIYHNDMHTIHTTNQIIVWIEKKYSQHLIMMKIQFHI